jgi:hypothetical protein
MLRHTQALWARATHALHGERSRRIAIGNHKHLRNKIVHVSKTWSTSVRAAGLPGSAAVCTMHAAIDTKAKRLPNLRQSKASTQPPPKQSVYPTSAKAKRLPNLRLLRAVINICTVNEDYDGTSNAMKIPCHAPHLPHACTGPLQYVHSRQCLPYNLVAVMARASKAAFQDDRRKSSHGRRYQRAMRVSVATNSND